MTGGGDLDEIEDPALDDEPEGTGDGEADAPVGVDVELNANDPDPTAGASDTGGLAGGLDVA
jgi:hypothetical protein